MILFRLFFCSFIFFIMLFISLQLNQKGNVILQKQKKITGKVRSVKAYLIQTLAMFLWVMSSVAFVAGVFLENLDRYGSFVFGMVACMAVLVWPLIIKATNIRKENIQNMKKNKNKNKNKK